MGRLETELRQSQERAHSKAAELTDVKNQNETLLQRHHAELAILRDEKENLLINSKEEIDKISGLLDATKTKLDNATGVISELEKKTADLNETVTGMENEKSQLSQKIAEKVPQLTPKIDPLLTQFSTHRKLKLPRCKCCTKRP